MLLHGYGANGDDLIELGHVWSRLPDTVFVSPMRRTIPDAAAACNGFRSRCATPSEYWRGVEAAGPMLDRFLDAELARYRLSAERLALVGFSQGTMMALHAGLRRARPRRHRRILRPDRRA